MVCTFFAERSLITVVIDVVGCGFHAAPLGNCLAIGGRLVTLITKGAQRGPLRFGWSVGQQTVGRGIGMGSNHFYPYGSLRQESHLELVAY